MKSLVLFAAFAAACEEADFGAFGRPALTVSAFSPESRVEKPTYRSVYARALAGEDVTDRLDDVPGMAPGRYRVFLHNGKPSILSAPEVAQRPFAPASLITRDTVVRSAGRASTGSAAITATAPTTTPARVAAPLGGTSAVPCLKG